ncbi:MAG: hypothetical protein ACKOSQ_11215 [Planctomycetaceae bacterium]
MKSRSPTSPQPHPVWICVFELHDPSIPRRSPDKPLIRLASKIVRPGPDLDAWVQRARTRKKSTIVRVHTQAMPGDHEPGGLHCPFEYPREQHAVKKALERLRRKLRCEGYTIGADQTVWHVYAIELDDAHIAMKPPNYRGHVYVGQTSHTVAKRVEQHRRGVDDNRTKHAVHSRYCHKHFRRHAPELVPAEFGGPLFCPDRALDTEYRLRRHLEQQGYSVVGATDRMPKKKPYKKPPKQ